MSESTQVSEFDLVDTDAVVQDNPNSFIHHSAIERLKSDFSFPPDWRVETPDLHNASCPALIPKASFAIHEYSMQRGLRFPLPDFAMLFLRENNLVPFQLHPKGWTTFMAFHVLCCLKEVVPTLHLFQCFFILRKCSDREGTFTIQRALRADSLFIDDIPKPPKKFYHHWFIIFPPEEFWNAPLRWCWTRPESKKI